MNDMLVVILQELDKVLEILKGIFEAINLS
jgi:hypothetical protein